MDEVKVMRIVQDEGVTGDGAAAADIVVHCAQDAPFPSFGPFGAAAARRPIPYYLHPPQQQPQLRRVPNNFEQHNRLPRRKRIRTQTLI